jgi:serine protease Do
VVDPEGYILTNEHVVDKAQSIRVTLTSKLEYPAEVIGTPSETIEENTATEEEDEDDEDEE